MGLKQIIRRRKILEAIHQDEFVMEGEPLIYCTKYAIGNCERPMQCFRNKQWRTMLRCLLPAYPRSQVPVVALVRFYVSPPERAKLTKEQLRKENVPAVFAYELCDYLLSFLEILHRALVDSYRQFVKIDMEKYYSDKPRIVFKFMRWDDYLAHKDTLYPQSKGVRKDIERQNMEPKRNRNESGERVCVKPSKRSLRRAGAGDIPLPDPNTPVSTWKKTRTAKLPTACEKTGHGQPREISE